MCDLAFPRWILLTICCFVGSGAGETSCYDDGDGFSYRYNGNLSLECTEDEFIVTVVLYPPPGNDDARRGVIRDLTISCVGHEEKIVVTSDQRFREYNDALSFTVSSVGYNGSCTLCGLYEDVRSLDQFQFTSRDCTIESIIVTTEYAFTPMSDTVASTESLNTTTVEYDPSNSGDYKDGQLVLVVSLTTICAILLFSVILILLSCWVWKWKESSWSDNVPYVTDIVQTFDPDFNPVKINVAATKFSSAESVQDVLFPNELSNEANEFGGQHSVHTDTSGEGYDSSSTDSYLVCSQADASTDTEN